MALIDDNLRVEKWTRDASILQDLDNHVYTRNGWRFDTPQLMQCVRIYFTVAKPACTFYENLSLALMDKVIAEVHRMQFADSSVATAHFEQWAARTIAEYKRTAQHRDLSSRK